MTSQKDLVKQSVENMKTNIAEEKDVRNFVSPRNY